MMKSPAPRPRARGKLTLGKLLGAAVLGCTSLALAQTTPAVDANSAEDMRTRAAAATAPVANSTPQAGSSSATPTPLTSQHQAPAIEVKPAESAESGKADGKSETSARSNSKSSGEGKAAKAEAKAAAKSTAKAESTGEAQQATIHLDVESYTLKNGLKVLLYEDHSSPLVSYQTWFRVGSKYEHPGLTGIAHLFEHLMFKGSKKYTGEQFDQILQSNGATNNAFTTQDYTGYYENLPSGKIETIMDLEADRMQFLNVTLENLNSEREVVKEERRYRVDNNPNGILHEALYETAYHVHPYRWPVIGSMADLANVTVENATEFYKTYYAPNNATLVIAGDFNTPQVKAMIEKHYGTIPSHEIPALNLPAEPNQTSPRSQFVSRDVQNTTFILSYHTPKTGAPESYALDLLGNILGNGDSSRLHQRLVYRDQAAAGVRAYNSTLQDSGLFEIYVALKPGADFNKVQRSTYGELWRPRHLGVTAAELEKAKNQVMKEAIDSLKSIHGKAESIALNETVYGDYTRLFTDLDKYNQVTLAQVKEVAVKYLAPETSTIVVLRPNKKGAR